MCGAIFFLKCLQKLFINEVRSLQYRDRMAYFVSGLVFLFVFLTSGECQLDHEYCLVDNLAGCELGRPPYYMVLAPRRIRPDQVFQVFATILQMEYGKDVPISVHVSVVKEDKEYASSVARFERPSSRIMQLQMPQNALPGSYEFRVEGRLTTHGSGIVFTNQTRIEFSPKYISLFIQMSKPIYKQEQMVHFRVIPVQPNLMPKYDNVIIYVLDPTGTPVRRWLAQQTNVGGMISQSFQLSDQPRYGTWHIKVEGFGHTYQRPFTVEEFWEPRFDVNVSVPAYMMNSPNAVIKGSVTSNHTSGRPCMGNATLTVFFRPREEIWNATRGWEKPYRDRLGSNDSPGFLPVKPDYIPVTEVPVKDYYMYFAYEYKFIDFYQGRIDFEVTKAELEDLAGRGGETTSLVDSEFMFFANVTDWYSDLNRTGWAGTIMYENDVKMRWVGGSVKTFKPGSILKVQVAVSRYDGTPVTDGGAVTIVQTVMTSAGNSDASASGPQTHPVLHGIAEFELFLGVHAHSFTLTASFQDPSELLETNTYINPGFVTGRSKNIEMRGTRYYSPSNSYISVTTSTAHPQVDEYIIFHVKVSHYVSAIFYQIMAQGNIIIGDELEMTSRQKTFSIGLSREMVPVARIVVYYIREPEEIVTDVLNFFVNGTRHNMVKLGINRGKDFTRDTIEFNAEADPGSYVAFSGMLLDLYSRGLSDGITENKLIDELMTYDEPANASYRQLWRVSDTEYEYKFFHGYDYGIDGTTSFSSAGMLILTDADVTRLPNQDSCDPSAGLHPCFSGIESDCFTTDERCNGVFDCENDGADEAGCEFEEKRVVHKMPMERISRVMRYYDNSSWAWQEIFVKPDGRVDFRVDVPKYPLTWVINGLSISQTLGLGIMEKPVMYDATRFMYMQVEHPKSIVWGEQIGIRVTVFNYWYNDDYIEVLVTMHGDDNIDMVTVGNMGYTTAYAPPTFKGDHQTIVFLEPGDSKDIYMPIVPSQSFRGDRLTFRVSATCFMEKDEYVGEMTVGANGVSNYYHTPYFVDLIKYPSVEIPQFKVNVPEQFRKPEIRPNLYVPQSPVGMMSFFGDVAMPGFFENYLNAENLLYRPYGGGEMVTFNFAYNLHTLRFMKWSNQLENVPLEPVLEEMNLALQRMLGYMDTTEGSFKMFRDSPKSSLWLTAFVGTTLSRVLLDWEKTLYIPRNLLSQIAQYICTKQNETSGAFEEDIDGVTFDRKMASLKNARTAKMYAHPIPMTAYVLIALHHMTNLVKSSAPCIENAKRKAENYLNREVVNLGSEEIFFLSISSYALSLTMRNREATNRLWNLKRTDKEYNYFADGVVYSNPEAWQDGTLRYLLPRQELLNDAYSVQSTAYAVLAHVQVAKKNRNEREMAISWMNLMRNSVAGFSSTQDTIIAMEALIEFARADRNRNLFLMSCYISATSSNSWERTMELKQNDFTHLHKVYLPMNQVWGYTIPSAQGAGRAMLQLTTTVNVEYDRFLKTQMHYNNSIDMPLMDFFEIEDTLRFRGRNASIMEMTNCVSWLFTERSLTSGLAVLEVDIPTGYIVMNDTLRDYVQSGLVPNLKRAEFYGRKLVFYFDYLDQSKTCVFFRADRWYPVANATRDHKLRVYDYYEPGMHRTKIYTTQDLFLLSICYACGSFQCPYCPYFNTAPALLHTGAVLCTLLLFGFLVQRLLFPNR
ncbi:CD109 antigen [Aplysia californica]|uniref:CD109 antigen n=1 Tax=Aplysia californica TaxID=6500 RepID=A0ABM0JTD9_APLCA|nr:CD109 antigen [Aplysia californica]